MGHDPLDVQAVRCRYAALAQGTVFLDAPAGTQVPDSVVDAMASYLRNANANLGGHFATSRQSELVVRDARTAAGTFLGCAPSAIGFGLNMTSLNFSLSRTVARTLRSGDEILVTRLDHDANIAPWLEIAADLDITVRFADIDPSDCTLDLADLERQLGERTRVVTFPWTANAVGTVNDVRRICALAHEAGALAWVDAVHQAPHGPIDAVAVGADILFCSPYKFFGPHLGVFYGRPDVTERWRPYKVRPAPDEPGGERFENGTLPHESLAGFTAAVHYIHSLGWKHIIAHERELATLFLAGLPSAYRLYGRPEVEGRVPTFAIQHPTLAPGEVAQRLAERDIAVWHGDYYAPEIMQRLGLPDGAVRIGFVHYNTADEVDRVLDELDRLLPRTLAEG
ncbi:MAG: cysteine desulfurase-like protein [Actinomycetia bacterium]|nr:cysteine desulfurase-like protein [Actinomycetes bacterium]